MRDCLLWGFVFAFVLTGCGESRTSSRFGDWTMTTDEVQLRKTLQVSETEAFYFGAITDLDVTTEGRIVVADRKAKNVKILAPDGSLVDTLGGPGEGPGEFQSLINVQVARGDSVYAYDYRRSRVTVFAPNTPYAVGRSISIPRDHGFVLHFLVLGHQFASLFSSGFRSPEEGIREPPPRTWRLVDEDGTAMDTLLRVRQSKMAVQSMGGGYRFRTIPFIPSTEVRGGPDDRLYYGWSDRLQIRARTVRGQTETIADIPAPSVPVSEAERDSAINEIDEDVRSLIASALPDTKPAFTDFAVADDGRVWVRRPATSVAAKKVEWWILDPPTKTIIDVQLPRETDVEVVQKGRVYGSTTTEMGAPAVVAYRMSGET